MTATQAAQLNALYQFLEGGPPKAGAWHDAFAELVTSTQLGQAIADLKTAEPAEPAEPNTPVDPRFAADLATLAGFLRKIGFA